ncbi:replication-associated recombination protein A [Aliiglaciecola sp. CAU 1673]|uniref:replication-associated recombination protein A n=1 Tax=Aliiglaciecola sp. CAU 1673 TaxID=3032595 RepID=UPI0023DB0FED|nr:replication-associated recombination protein A [Aliiglaciecola sp. CAU 1673]MDF2177613.1 replication-associated recombination protein A [Aliiglaciecola sp. CAU 1673]
MTQDLFAQSQPYIPLAARLRPTSLEDYVGQSHILGPGKALRQALERGRAHSMILWGPPGTGKTTLAELVANYSNAHVERISAVTSGIKDIRQAIDNARHQAQSRGKMTLLFVDEVHRFNKSQQDAFLPHIEDGTVIFVGATTENPSFELNGALLSRARVYLLKALNEEEMALIIQRALPLLGDGNLVLDDDAKQWLITQSGGDARRLLNYLELAADFAQGQVLDLATVREAAGGKVTAFDKGGDRFYDMLSALHKSVRGSSPDGALYWFARMLEAGCDPLQAARRLLAIASEDIGNADPRALQICLNAWDIFQRVGPAEGERAIAQAIIYCACAPKSNAVYMAFNQARQDARERPDYEVPVHLRNAPTKLMKSLGYGEEYRYAHNEPGAYAAGECYLPEDLKDNQYYHPSSRGLEKQIAEKLAYLREQDKSSERRRYK